MRLTLVIPSLERGGAERIMALLASAWAERGWAVRLITFDDSQGLAYPVHSAVTLTALGIPNEPARGLFQALSRNAQRLRALRRRIRESVPDLVISFLEFPNILTLLATRGLRMPVIVSERANPSHVPTGVLWRVLRRLMYPRADAVVCQTRSMVDLIHKRIPVRGYAISNPVVLPVSDHAQQQGRDADGRTVIAMGRLVPEKGFDLLLEAFSRVAERHREWTLTILGAGPLRSQLEAQAGSLGLKNRVSFPGALADPFPVLRAADLFVFSSRFEGFGNALSEAMACGLPAISFDCAAGPSEIVRAGVDGILVPPGDVTALADAMDRLMGDDRERQRLARRAPDVLERFSLERVLASWDELLADVLPSQTREGAASFPREQESAPPHGRP